MGERSTSLRRLRPACWAAAATLAATAPSWAAGPVLDSLSPNLDGIGYGGYQWKTVTADLNAAAGGSVATTADLSNAAALLGYTGIWVDIRQPGTGALSPAERSALSAYINTGRRAVLVGGNTAFTSWNASILGLVGGTDGGPGTDGTVRASAAVVPLTIGVGSVYARSGDVAAGGSGDAPSLFDQRLATVWGPARNVVVLLNENVLADTDVTRAGNGTFAANLTAWVGGAKPDAACLWQSPVGGPWRAGGNWQSTAMPAVADDAIFNLAATYTATLDGPLTAGNVFVRSDRVTLDLSTATAGLTVGGTVSVGQPASTVGSLSLTHSLGGGTAVVSTGTVAVGGSGAGALSVGSGVQLTVAGATTVADGSSLTVTAGGTMVTGSLSATGPVAVAGRLAVGIASPAGHANVVGGLTVDGQLDLSHADLIVRGGDVAAVTALAARAYSDGTWAGGGLTSSVAAADPQHLTAVGVVPNVGPTAVPTFDGQPVTATDVLVKVTTYGDANLDGVVNAADYARIDAGYLRHATGWANGDFNYDGVVDGSDYTLIDNAFNQQAPLAAVTAAATAEVATVPEPGMVLGIALAGMLVARRPPRRPTRPPA